ncbi:MAG: exosortase/archaeosortase family protein [Balneola sp.]|mgnify:CR=1 FL=1|jgi:exosortase family protein XrtF|nr:exosortase/archaeosortase family protein [Balneola sp.]MBE78625.1 exosortase/archaeosortase family protein [Balneola sp.]HBX67700.1 exosortase/archaeosortase family protein [Balneolaceae bacterium]|tara:strand:+ start:1281 stop:1805 length:525 start_codon:yes stop_codon:yes gene_type:complete
MNSPLTKFIAKALLIFTGWYLLYEMWLLPDGSLDEWLSLNIIGASAGFIELLGYDVYTVNRIIGIGEYPGIEIVDGCNGIAAMGLFFGFILAYPGDWKNRLSFSVVGVGIIYLVNIVRVITLTITQVEWPEFFDFTHDYSTAAIFYIVIFVLWMVWVNFADANFDSKSQKVVHA